MGATFNRRFCGSDCALYHVSSYQFRGSCFVTCPVAASFTVDVRVKGLLPRVFLNPSSATADSHESSARKRRVSSGLIHRTGTLASCFCRPDTSLSVSSPLIPSAPTASTASRDAFQLAPSRCSFSSAMRWRLVTFFNQEISYLTYICEIIGLLLPSGLVFAVVSESWPKKIQKMDP
jgi:hypothetical protein